MTDETSVDITTEEDNKPALKDSSVPRFDEFNPTKIPFQHRSLWDIKREFDYRTGTKVVLFSGAVGSAKSVMAAHLIWLHALENPGACIGIGRKDLKRLKSTLLKTVRAHAPKNWKENVHYKFNKSEHKITLPNKSVIQCFSWADNDYERFKSEEFSMFVIEEASENTQEIYDAVIQRLGRLTHVKECMLLLCTNPDEPDHWINREVIMKAGYVDGKKRIGDKDVIDENIHVYYSLTVQNPFLPKSYLQGLLKKYNAKQVQRYLEGKWISYGGEGLYFAYDENIHFKLTDYVVNLQYPIHICMDFNIAKGKPMSFCLAQYINDTFHFFDEAIVDGASTSKILAEMELRGMFKYKTKYIVNGDAAGYNRAMNNGLCDYDIVKSFFDKLKTEGFDYKIAVDLKNPDIKARHNTVNSYMMNGLGQSRLFVYKRCKVLNEGFKLTQLKDGAKYLEDDNNRYQHVTTAAGYCIVKNTGSKGSATVLKF